MNKLITAAASIAAITLGVVNDSLETRVANLESLAVRQMEQIKSLTEFDTEATELFELHGSTILENRNKVAGNVEILIAAGNGFERQGERLDQLESTYLRSMAIDWVFMDILTKEFSTWLQQDRAKMSEVELRMLDALLDGAAESAKKEEATDA